MRFAVSDTRLDSADPFLFHKTTRRELYDREWQHYSDTMGADEVIYLNERGELAEGSRTNIFIERDGVLVTPPLTSGLLPGVLRSELIATGKAVEQMLTLDDLEAADARLSRQLGARACAGAAHRRGRAAPLIVRSAISRRLVRLACRLCAGVDDGRRLRRAAAYGGDHECERSQG